MPPSFTFESYDALAEDFSSYIERLESYFLINEIKEEKKAPAVLSLMGSSTYKLLKNLCTPKVPADLSYQEIVKTLSEHLNPKPLEMTERFRFYKRNQFEGESISDYCAELKKLSINCNFGNNLNEMLRDRLVMGLRNENIQKKLLSESDLKYENAKNIALSMECAQRDVNEIHSQSASVKKLNSANNLSRKTEYAKSKVKNNVSASQKNGKQSRCCFRCGDNSHLAHECKYINFQCKACFKTGHLAKVCRSRPKQSIKQIDTNSYVPMHFINSSRDARKKILLDVFLENKKVVLELDTGAAVTCMNIKKFRSLCPHVPIKKTDLILKNFDQSVIIPVGQATVNVRYQNQTSTECIYLVNENVDSVFGREWLRNIKINWEEIKLIQTGSTREKNLNNLLQKYKSLFAPGIGKLDKFVCRLHIKKDAEPKFCKPRPVPFSLKERIESELDRLVQEDILEPVEHSDWATPIVPVIKQNGKLRICGDYKVTINPVLQVDQYPLPRIEDIFADLSGGEAFSKIDLSEAYLQMTVDERDRHLLTINTHKGLFRYKRLNYGVALALAFGREI